MRFHKRLRHCSLQALAWFPHYDISVRYVATPCIYIHIHRYISGRCIYPVRYELQSGLIYTTICQSDMSPDPNPCCKPPHPLRCVKRQMWSTKKILTLLGKSEWRCHLWSAPKNTPTKTAFNGAGLKMRKYSLQSLENLQINFYYCVQVLLRLSKYGACPWSCVRKGNLCSDYSEKLHKIQTLNTDIKSID